MARASSFTVIARGDCSSRRTLEFCHRWLGSATLATGRWKVVQDAMSRSDFLVDTIRGEPRPTITDLRRHLDFDQMDALQREYLLSQRTHRTLRAKRANLIVLDDYADMNFKASRHREAGWKLWMDPAYLRDPERFEREFEVLGRLSVEESIDNHVRLIEHYRRENGHIPVLFLQQPTRWYSKLSGRRAAFDVVGPTLEHRLPDVYVADLAAEELQPDDMDSCGPGSTLHVDEATHERMVQRALDKGLGDWIRAMTDPAIRWPVPVRRRQVRMVPPAPAATPATDR